MLPRTKPIAKGTPSEIDVRSKKDYEEFCFWVGHALSRWSLLESELAFLYAVTLSPPTLLPAVESFYAATSFDAKLKQLDAVIRIELYKESQHLKSWEALKRRLSNVQKRRNQLAHGRVLATSQNRQGHPTEYYGTHLIPYYGRLRANQGGATSPGIETIKKYAPIDLKQLIAIIESIDSRAAEISVFAHKAIFPRRFGKKAAT